MPEELNPCPFCGDDQPALAEEQDTGAWSITCIHCGIEIGNYAGERSVRSAWNRRTPVQPGPAAPTPDTFMGEPVLTRWKPLNRDDSRLALHQSMHNRSFGNPSDDKLMLEWLWENGYALCKRVPDEAAPTPQQQALDRMVENAETLGLYEAAPTEATLDQMAGKAWDRFQRHTAELQALENCRLYAARHRKEDWAATILRFCADGGATGSPLREAAPTVVEPEPVAAYRPTCDVLLRGVGTGWPDFIAPQRLFTPNDVLYAAPPRTPLTEELEALRELVACEDMRLEVQSVRSDPYYLTEADALELQYEQRRDKAWDRARAVIAADRGQG